LTAQTVNQIYGTAGGLYFWTSGDQLLKSAGLKVQIAEELMR